MSKNFLKALEKINDIKLASLRSIKLLNSDHTDDAKKREDTNSLNQK